MYQNFMKWLIVGSPIYVLITWVVFDIWDYKGFLFGALSVVIFLGINLYSITKNFKKSFLSLLSFLYLIGFLILSFMKIWGEHHALMPLGSSETGVHKHIFWDLGHVH